MESSSQVVPNIFKTRHASFTLEVYHENSLTPKVVDTFIQATFGDVIGLAPTYGSKRALTTLALFNGTKALLVRFPSSKAKPKQVSPGRALLQRLLLTPLRKLAFKMDILATALYKDIGLHTNRGVDLLSVSTTDARCSTNALMFVLGGEVMLNKATVVELFTQEETQTPDLSNTALQAWAAYQAAYLERTSKLLVSSAEVVTTALDRKHLILVTNVIRDAACLVALKPMRQKNEIGNDYSHKQGKLEVKSVRFKTRLMQNRNANQVIEIQSTNDKRVSAKLTKVNGRAASLALRGPLSGRIQSVTTVGREPLTKAEEIRGLIALKVLTGSSQIMEYQFVRRIWRLSKNISWDGLPSLDGPVAISFPGRTLNASQLKSVTAILSKNDNDRITLIQGPPGTGKTTVIAAAITSVIASADPERTIWVVAQSNVAVKNVAEKLADVSFLDFKILVSKDFHFDWHEHLYHEIEGNVIRSDDMQASIVSTERLLLGSRIILCTLSMLSHDRLTPYVHLVPPQTIIVDEASQIEVGDYLPPLQRFRATLCKLVFIGDNKQLAPYGRSDIPGLHSIFEMSHLQNRAIFLDTQYRMPTPIGDFISREVYAGRLKSQHSITSWLSCSFIDVANGREEKSGHSWVNMHEVATTIGLATILHALGKSFKIITPYDAQRSKLENALKETKVPWEDTCFNVDSFQGNEADYIILSIVRSEKIGFMNDARRTNVMLTRCKKNMIIVSKQRFVEGVASTTLIGKLAKACGRSWIKTHSILNRTFRPST